MRPVCSAASAFRIVGRKDLELRVHDQQIAGVAVEFDFAVEGHAQAGQEAVGEIAAMKPFGEQPFARRVRKDGFEQAKIAPAESGADERTSPRRSRWPFPRAQAGRWS